MLDDMRRPRAVKRGRTFPTRGACVSLSHLLEGRVARRIAGVVLYIREESIGPGLSGGSRLELAQVERVLGQRYQCAHQRTWIVWRREHQARSSANSAREHRGLARDGEKARLIIRTIFDAVRQNMQPITLGRGMTGDSP